MNMKLVAWAAPLVLLAACSTQPAVESGNPESNAAASATERSSARSGQLPSTSSAMSRNTPRDLKVAKRSVYYEFDKADLKPEQRATVEANAKYLREHPDLKVQIEGNTDERGSREYNLALGQKRAESVMKTMSLLGVASSRMESVSYGEEKPKATGHDDSSWDENRRSDIVYP